MECRIGDAELRYVEHGAGRAVLVLHGAGVDHREVESCFEPALSAYGGLRRIYLDLPGMGESSAPESLRSADDVLAMLVAFVDEIVGDEAVLLVGHSAGGYYGQGFTAQQPDRVAGLALICPLLAGVRDVPGHHPVVAGGDLGDEAFRAYFVVQTPAMFERYQRFVAPAVRLADAAAAARIGERWELTVPRGRVYDGAVLVVAGRQDSTVGYAAACDLLDHYPRATFAVLDGAGHALPHEQPELLAGLLREWLTRTGTSAGAKPAASSAG